jgi:hypothetical protein
VAHMCWDVDLHGWSAPKEHTKGFVALSPCCCCHCGAIALEHTAIEVEQPWILACVRLETSFTAQGDFLLTS